MRLHDALDAILRPAEPLGLTEPCRKRRQGFGALRFASAPDTRSGGTPYAASAEAGA